MDQYVISSANIQAVQWPLDLYANLNPADGWRPPALPGNPTALSPAVNQPETVQNNLSMLIALNDFNLPFLWAARESGTDAINQHAVRIAAQDINFANETINQKYASLQYVRIKAMGLLKEEPAHLISLMA
jgi:hypothetical protein